jgi:serine-type D-Ala-D-Ala carboxypeptidase/endopeptidase (penicillin-binding protein 4)
MSAQPMRMRGRVRLPIALMLAALVAASPGASQAAPPAPVGVVPAGAQKVMDKQAYSAARWLHDVADLKSGEVLLANRPSELVYSGSTAKLFTIGSAYALLGPDFRLTTPVYATAPVAGGVLDGDLVLVAAGDLALGGRGAMEGKVTQQFTATTADQVDADIVPNAVPNPEDPLAGLDSLAAQVAANGVARITGDVLIDDRLWQTRDFGDDPAPPIVVNDNLLDITVTPAAVGATAAAAQSPPNPVYTVVSTVTTQAGSDVALSVAADPTDPRRLVVGGTIGAEAGPRLTTYRIPDAAAWARSLFIAALGRAGVAVAADPTGPNPAHELPARGTYDAELQLAALTSPPLGAFGTMILLTSYDTGANTVLCLLAVHQGATDCLAGLQPIRQLIDQAGLVSDDVVLVDGQGGDPDSVTPEQMVRWLVWTQAQPWGATLEAGLPVLGESGTLVIAGRSSPARGKVRAKTGTSAHLDPATGRILFNVQSMAGYMQGQDGRTLVFDVSMSGGTYPSPLEGLIQSTDDVAEVAAQFQQALVK